MKRLLFALIWISVLSLGSCVVSEDNKGAGNGIDEQTLIETNSFLLALDIENRPGHSVSNSRVTALTEETKVNNLYLLFFEYNDNREGKFVDYKRIENPTVADNLIDMSNTQLEVRAAYNILAIANIEETTGGMRYLNGLTPDAWMQQWAGKTEQEVIEQAQAWTVKGVVEADQLLMSGSVRKPANTFTLDLKLVRNMIRFDVVSNVTGYTLSSVSIYNAYPASKIWNDGTGKGALNYSDGVSRIRDYYGYNYDPGMFATNTNFKGHFYVFENQVTMPVQNDELTTCLIVGLDGPAAGSSDVSYYRINIAPKDQPQMLYRNHAYTVSINSILKDGKDTRIGAYDDPDDARLNYIINQWGDGEVGVADQDNNSMLSSPYKTVNLDIVTGEIRGRRDRGQSPDRFLITTVSSLPDPTKAAIVKSEFHLNASAALYDGITVTLDNNNNLVFSPVKTTADGLKNTDKVTGYVTVGYAGLRITIDVVQSELITHSLNVYQPDGGLPRFAPFEGVESEMIRVDASGPWSAQIASDPQGVFGFVAQDGAFKPGNNLSNIGGTYDHDNNASTPEVACWTGNEFSVKTLTNNTDPQNPREAFIIITLDSDPLNYSKVIRVTQMQKTEVAITPSQSITFDGTFDNSTQGMQDGLAGNIASIPNNKADNKYVVLPGTTGDEPSVTQNEWTYRIEVMDADGLWKVAYYEPGTGNPYNGQNSALAAKQWFAVTPVHNTTVGQENSFKIDVTGKNTSGSTRKGRVMVYLKANASNPDGAGIAKAVIYVDQLSSGITLSPNSVPAVAKVGGESNVVSIQADGSLQWKIEDVAVTYGKTSGSARNVTSMVNHKIEIIGSGSANAIATVNGSTPTYTDGLHPVTETFKVKFPMIYYPNRELNVEVKVKVRIYDAANAKTDLAAEMKFTQTPLTSPGMYPYAPQIYGYGNIHGGSYNHRYIAVLKQHESTRPTTSLTVNSNYMHMNYEGLSATYDWAAVKYFRQNRDGLLLVNCDPDYNPNLAMLNNSNSVLRSLGYKITGVGSAGIVLNGVPFLPGTDSRINTNASVNKTKVYRMLIEAPAPNFNPGVSNIGRELYTDDISTKAYEYPANAVPIIVTGRMDNHAIIVIDPENNIIFQGDAPIFDTNAGNEFLENYLDYIFLASKWGRSFTSLMVGEDGVAGDLLPAPWNDYWGANKGLTR